MSTDDSAAATLAVVLVGAPAFGGIGDHLWHEQISSARPTSRSRRRSSPRR